MTAFELRDLQIFLALDQGLLRENFLARRQFELDGDPFLSFYRSAIDGIGLVLPLLDGACRRFREERISTQHRDVPHCPIPEDLGFELYGSLDVL
jgi:hypothetical protein